MFEWLFGTRPAQASKAVPLAGDGSFSQEIVGESHYQEALSDTCGGHCEEGHDHRCEALLEPEPSNMHDPKAVRVTIGGKTVGYLSRDEAPDFHKGMHRFGSKVGRCRARINGGWRRPRGKRFDEGHFGVELDLIWPLQTRD